MRLRNYISIPITYTFIPFVLPVNNKYFIFIPIDLKLYIIFCKTWSIKYLVADNIVA